MPLRCCCCRRELEISTTVLRISVLQCVCVYVCIHRCRDGIIQFYFFLSVVECVWNVSELWPWPWEIAALTRNRFAFMNIMHGRKIDMGSDMLGKKM